MLAKSKRMVWILGTMFALLALPFLLSLMGLLPWSPINCWHHDVDIHSGRIRYTRYFVYLPVVKRVEESPLSRALAEGGVSNGTPDWRRVMTLSPGVHNSPHYLFHSAMAQMRELETLWQMGGFAHEARRSSARQVLQLWQKGQSDAAAQPYLHEVGNLAARSNPEHNAIQERDLPTAP